MNTIMQNKFDRLLSGSEQDFVIQEQEHLAASVESINNSLAKKVRAVGGTTLLGKKEVVQETARYDLSKISALLPNESDQIVEKDPVAGIIYNLVNIKRMLRVAQTVMALEPNAPATYSLVNAVVGLCKNMSSSPKIKSANAFHYAFGGQIQDLVIDSYKGLQLGNSVYSALKSIGEDLDSFKTMFTELQAYTHSYYIPAGKTAEYRSLVKVTTQKVTLTDKGTSKFSTSISWRDMERKVSYAGQTLFAMINKNNEAVISTAAALPLVERVGILHASGVDIEGLREHPTAMAVILFKNSDKGKRQAEWVKVPFADGLEDYVLTSSEGIKSKAIGERLKKGKIVPFYKKEVYGKHGYVMCPDAIIRQDNAFCSADGLSEEDYGKLIVRLAKCAQAEHKYRFKSTTHVVALYDDAPVGSVQERFNQHAIRNLVDGHANSSIEQHKQIGACRVVSGEMPGDSGQKTMLADPLMTLTEKSMAAITAAIGYKGIYTLVGLSSTKAKSFKKQNGFELIETIFEGEVVKFWKKSVKETLLITDSSVSENWEFNPDHLPKLEGVRAALDTYERRIMGKKSQTVFELLYNNRSSSINLVEAVKYYRDLGIIKFKEGKSRTNSQFITALETQFSRELGESVMTSLVRQNKASDYRKSVALSTSILKEQTAGVVIDAFDVDVVSFSRTLFNTQANLGEVFENASQQVFSAETVLGVASYLSNSGKEYIRFKAGDSSAVIGISNSMLTAVEPVEREGYCKVSGLLAEVLYAVNRGLVSAVSETPEGTDLTITDSIARIMVERIAMARDNHLGKELTRVPTHGCNGHVIGSPLLRGNQLFSMGANTAVAKAVKSFYESVVVFYFKSPVLWEGSLTMAQIVRQAEMLRILSEEGEGLHNFNIDWEEFAILNGKAMYQSPEKIVGNGNDSDGDRNSVICAPLSAVKAFAPFIKKLNHKHVVDAMDSAIAVGGLVAKAKWDKEVKGLYYSSLGTSVSHKTTVKGWEQGVLEAVIASSSETKNVAIYTTFQSQVQMHKPEFIQGGAAWIVNHANEDTFTLDAMRDLISKPLANAGVFAVEYFVAQLHSFLSDVQGTIVNIDAMDAIKHEDGKKAVKLAALLNPKRVYNATQDTEDLEGNRVKRSIEGGNTASYIKLVRAVSAVIFNKDSHNLSIERMLNFLPQGTDVKVLQDYVVRVLMAGLVAVGEVLANSTSYTSILIKDHDVSLETAITDAKALGLPVVKDTSLIRFTLKVAYAHKGEKLITISKKNGNKITK